ncbi:hypothetical protein BDZ85DRAFT_264620 [Elsinoe ampelina]|uniref:Uncharacterized protein n=1 Tax=Elsinoe ampelina TaxID=302913 RepID=A0A6A6G8D6_9PEZI|nr:hypothetical protein BDZ85DRAFT_264620 [Elsinoe ampelina]
MHPSGVPQNNNQESNSQEEENQRHDDSEREATELSPIRRPADRESILSLPDQRPWISRFWRSNIALSVPHDACRDHVGSK